MKPYEHLCTYKIHTIVFMELKPIKIFYYKRVCLNRELITNKNLLFQKMNLSYV